MTGLSGTFDTVSSLREFVDRSPSFHLFCFQDYLSSYPQSSVSLLLSIIDGVGFEEKDVIFYENGFSYVKVYENPMVLYRLILIQVYVYLQSIRVFNIVLLTHVHTKLSIPLLPYNLYLRLLRTFSQKYSNMISLYWLFEYHDGRVTTASN